MKKGGHITEQCREKLRNNPNLGYYEGNNNYTEDEIDIIRKNYPISTESEIMKLFPYRNYSSIRMLAFRLGIKKEKDTLFRIKSSGQKGKKMPESARDDNSKRTKERMKNMEMREQIASKLRRETTPARKQLRMSYHHKHWRDAVYERDNWTCQHCGSIGGKLNAHHIIGFAEIILDNNITTFEDGIKCKELWSVHNGITLCVNCHSKMPNHAKLIRRGYWHNKRQRMLQNVS